jgi:N-methylhydantoinase A
LRYIGQGYELTIPLAGVPRSAEALAELRRSFDEAHAVLTGHAAPDERVELVNVRVTSVAAVPQASVATPPSPLARNGKPIGMRDAYLGERFARTPVYDRRHIDAGAIVEGPAILVQDDSTTVVHPGQTARVVALGQLEIRSN